MKDVVSTPFIPQKLASHAQSAQKTIATASANGFVTLAWSRLAALTFSPRLGPGVMEDADTQSFILRGVCTPFPPPPPSGNEWRRSKRFLLMYFVRFLPCSEWCRGNIKLISEGNAIQTERSFTIALRYLVLLGLVYSVSGTLSIFEQLLLG